MHLSCKTGSDAQQEAIFTLIAHKKTHSLSDSVRKKTGSIRGHASTPPLSKDAFYTTATLAHYISLLIPAFTHSTPPQWKNTEFCAKPNEKNIVHARHAIS